MTAQPGEQILSVRPYLASGIADMTSLFGAEPKEVEWITELILILSNYQEEGLQLFPVVFVARDLEVLLDKLGAKDPIHIGSGPGSKKTLRKAFKQCAPLAEDRQWALYLLMGDGELRFGVVRVEQSPLRPTAFERLRRLSDPEIKILGITRIGANFVELRAPNEAHLYIDLLGAGGDAYNPARMIRQFTQIITRDCPEEIQPMLRAFYYQFGVDLLHATHGSMVALISADQKKVPSVLADGIFLRPHIQIADAIEKYSSSPNSDGMQRLRSYKQLLRKMNSMDGIVVLNTCGTIIGYNCFIPSAAIDAEKRSSPPGGARRRAFDALSARLGEEGLEGVLYRSQDGWAGFKAAQK